MVFHEQTLDDLLNVVYTAFRDRPFEGTPTRAKKHGKTAELIGVKLTLDRPEARLSRSQDRGLIFSRLGELLWYLSGDNDLNFIRYYLSHYEKESEDGLTIYGGYGKRFFSQHGMIDQVGNIINLLKKKPQSRRAVIQIFDANDIDSDHIEIPCTCCLQFLIRDGKLHLIVYMRSNDVYLGLPHDVFCFTMIQEIVARSISNKLKLGSYQHLVGSFHLYESNKNKIEAYIQEGYQSTLFPMPLMPLGDPWPSISRILELERQIRTGWWDLSQVDLDVYWLDFVQLFRIFYLVKAIKTKSLHIDHGLEMIRQVTLKNHLYDVYVESTIARLSHS